MSLIDNFRNWSKFHGMSNEEAFDEMMHDAVENDEDFRDEMYNRYDDDDEDEADDEDEDDEDPYGDDEDNPDGFGDQHKSPEELAEEEEQAGNGEDKEQEDKKKKKKEKGKGKGEKGEVKGGVAGKSKKPNPRQMMKEAKDLKALPCPYPRSCPFCKQRSIFYEPAVPWAVRKGISYILHAVSYSAVPIRKTRYICLNPKCKAYYTKYGTRFIDNPIDFGGALLPSHLIDIPQNPFRLRDNYK